MNQSSNESTSQSCGRPTWAEIDLDALAHNYHIIRQTVGAGVKVLAAVKANAYGHGAVQCAHRLQHEGVDWFGVALPEEGIELRAAAITKPILCLAGFWEGQQGACLQHNLTPVVYRVETLESLNSAAAERNVIADVHVKIDTGMGRLGMRFDAVTGICENLKRFKHIRVDGLMTHLASADEASHESSTTEQLKRFHEAIDFFRAQGFAPTHIHAANSAALFSLPESRGNMVRPGGTLYGFSRDVLPTSVEAPPLLPVMSLHSRIMLLKKVPRGEALGYGGTFATERDSLIATIPIGYDDGYRRALSNHARVIVRGTYAPIVGRVSMDLTLLDVTDVPGVSQDDKVTLLGRDHDLLITAEEIAGLAGTISYEITCGIAPRVSRIYL